VEGDWASYLAARSKNFHQVLKNKTNRLTREGGFRCVAYETPDEVEGILPTIFEVDARSWKGRAGTAIGSSEGARRFYTELSKSLARRGEVSIWVLWRADRPVAFEYHVLYDGVVFSMKWSYDQEHHAFSPGLVLKRASTEHFWKRGVREIDLLGNADGFKLKWTSDVRRHVNLYAFNRGAYARAVERFEFGVKPFLKRQPLIARAVDRVRGQHATTPATDD
jgi:CelD/BcsL family acetyltransferase involved in cellulose biosynthesis